MDLKPKYKRVIWTLEECAEYFGKNRQMNHATRDEVLTAIKESIKKRFEHNKQPT